VGSDIVGERVLGLEVNFDPYFKALTLK